MSAKLFIATFLAVVCLCHARSKVSAKVKSGGSLHAVSRQSDEFGDNYGGDEFSGDFGDEFGGDFGDENETGYDEPEPEVKSAPTKKPEPKIAAPKMPAPELPSPKLDMGPAKPKLHMEYTTKYPTHCPCMLGKGMHNGVCFEFTSGKQCKGRPCKPSYVCIDGPPPKKAVTCIRKKNTKQVVSNGDGTCKVKTISAYGYAPYSS